MHVYRTDKTELSGGFLMSVRSHYELRSFGMTRFVPVALRSSEASKKKKENDYSGN